MCYYYSACLNAIISEPKYVRGNDTGTPRDPRGYALKMHHWVLVYEKWSWMIDLDLYVCVIISNFIVIFLDWSNENLFVSFTFSMHWLYFHDFNDISMILMIDLDQFIFMRVHIFSIQMRVKHMKNYLKTASKLLHRLQNCFKRASNAPHNCFIDFKRTSKELNFLFSCKVWKFSKFKKNFKRASKELQLFSS